MLVPLTTSEGVSCRTLRPLAEAASTPRASVVQAASDGFARRSRCVRLMDVVALPAVARQHAGSRHRRRPAAGNPARVRRRRARAVRPPASGDELRLPSASCASSRSMSPHVAQLILAENKAFDDADLATSSLTGTTPHRVAGARVAATSARPSPRRLQRPAIRSQ